MLGVGEAIHEDVGPPVRFVTAADIEHERFGADRDRNPAPVEAAQPFEERHG